MRRSPSAALASLLVTVLLVAGCTGGATDGPPPDEPTGATSAWSAMATWEPCPDLPRESLEQAMPAGVLPGILLDLVTGLAISVLTAGRTYECATVPVPQDWSNPDSGETFDIALVRVRGDDAENRIGSLVVNPGGPGASGVDAAVYLSLPELVGGLPDEVLEHFDIVGFDPRGVGRSSPVDCFSDADLDEMFGAEPDPVTDQEFAEAVAASQRRTSACGNQYGDTLRYFSTRQTAHDLNLIRSVVGDEQLTYLGYSYGTLLGAVYAHLYPQNVRAMVLDGAVDPQPTGEGGGQAAGFERAFGNFADWCDSSPLECPLGPDTRATVTEAIEQARVSPVPGDDGRAATAGWVFLAVISTLYVQELWPQLGDAIADLQQGDPDGVFTLADIYTGRDGDGSYPNLFDANTAINCADSDSRPTVAEVRTEQERLRGEYPMFGAPLAVGALDCAHWPAEPDPYPVGPAEGAPPIMVIGTTGDPATPYESTARLADLLGTGVVVTHEGEGHTVYPQAGCINEAVHAYLIDLSPPAAGTVC
ncbi:MAG TPA: alpha/beta hydrolase [Natronosporangium sp.]